MKHIALCSTIAVGLIATASSAAGVIAYGYPYASQCPGAGLAERVDRWKMYTCNCTSYVAWALNANGERTDWFIPGSMDARNWVHVAHLKGIAVGRLPRVGAVAVWPRLSEFGHVAYVTGLERDGGFDRPGRRGLVRVRRSARCLTRERHVHLRSEAALASF